MKLSSRTERMKVTVPVSSPVLSGEWREDQSIQGRVGLGRVVGVEEDPRTVVECSPGRGIPARRCSAGSGCRPARAGHQDPRRLDVADREGVAIGRGERERRVLGDRLRTGAATWIGSSIAQTSSETVAS